MHSTLLYALVRRILPQQTSSKSFRSSGSHMLYRSVPGQTCVHLLAVPLTIHSQGAIDVAIEIRSRKEGYHS
jgi:hypothetical protein